MLEELGIFHRHGRAVGFQMLWQFVTKPFVNNYDVNSRGRQLADNVKKLCKMFVAIEVTNVVHVVLS